MTKKQKKQILALLENIEWSDTSWNHPLSQHPITRGCPECGKTKERGHLKTCGLGRLIKWFED